MAELSKQLVDAMKQSAESKTSAFDSIGTVRRVKDGIAYVHLAGGVDETPVQLTVDAKTGDEVQVRVSGGRAWIVGNATAPPTDNTMAKQAINYGKIANDAAQKATKDALVANEAAQSASASAREAKETTDEINAYAETAGKTITQILNDGETAGTAAQQAKAAADSAMKGLGQVEDVVGTLNWITEHSKVTTDTTPTAGKSYYIKNQDETFTLVTDVEGKNPAQEGWYELTEAVQNYILSHLALVEGKGLYVMKDGSKWKVNIADDGVYILDENVKPVNQMTDDGNIIGYEDETHAEIDYHSMQLIDNEGNPYFYVSDLRTNHTDQDEFGEGFYAVYEDDFVGDGNELSFNLSYHAYDTDYYHVYVNGVEVFSTDVIKNVDYVAFPEPPVQSTTIKVRYRTTDTRIKAYTLGTRMAGQKVGGMSCAEGENIIASGIASHGEGGAVRATGKYSHAEGYATYAVGKFSHAEGKDSRANGDFSHAEGDNTKANGEGSHAEGLSTVAGGQFAHAQNYFTIANHLCQTVIGQYNDNKRNNAFEIGNGADDNNRSNAFEVDWSGNVNASGDIEDGQGNILADKLQEDSNGDVSITRNVSVGGDVEDGQGNVLSDKADTSSLATVATSGDYDDLSNKPTIPAVPDDYIVSTGTTSGWSWRKWASGRMEAEKEVSTGSTWTSVAAGFYYNQVTITPPSGMLFRHGYAVPTVASNWLTGAQVQGKDSTVKLTIHRLSGSSATFTYRVVLVGVAS